LETMVTVPIRSDSVQYDTVPPLLSPDTVHICTVPDAAYTVLDSTDTVQYGTVRFSTKIPYSLQYQYA
jgi:hypothetical protein